MSYYVLSYGCYLDKVLHENISKMFKGFHGLNLCRFAKTQNDCENEKITL